MEKSKKQNIKKWFKNLSNKKAVHVSDLDSIANLFFNSVKKARELHSSADKTTLGNLKTSLNILSMEEFSKPLILAEIIPPINKKLILNDSRLDNILNTVTSHESKQLMASIYGKQTDSLGYKVYLDKDEITNLQYLKENGLYTDIDYHTGHVSAGVDDFNFSNKVNSFIKERLESFFMYNSIEDSRFFVRHLSFFHAFDRETHFMEFMNTVDLENTMNYEYLFELAYNFKSKNQGSFSQILINKETKNIDQLLIGVISKHIEEDRQILINNINNPTNKFIKNKEILDEIIYKSL